MAETRDLTAEILNFRDERDWQQFHTLKNLAAGLAIEAAELQETMLWLAEDQVVGLLKDDPRFRERIAQELADTFIYGLLIAAAADLDPAQIIREKLAQNAQKYPVEKARGRSAKYTEL